VDNSDPVEEKGRKGTGRTRGRLKRTVRNYFITFIR